MDLKVSERLQINYFPDHNAIRIYDAHQDVAITLIKKEYAALEEFVSLCDRLKSRGMMEELAVADRKQS